MVLVHGLLVILDSRCFSSVEVKRYVGLCTMGELKLIGVRYIVIRWCGDHLLFDCLTTVQRQLVRSRINRRPPHHFTLLDKR